MMWLWAMLPVVVSYFAEFSYKGLRIESIWAIAVLAPFVEEIAKYLMYRTMRPTRWTLIVPLWFIVFEAFRRPIESGSFGIEGLGMSFHIIFASIVMWKHILFWAIQYMGRFKLWTLPVAIVMHGIWNLWVLESSPYDSIFAGVLALAGIWVVLAYVQKIKGGWTL